MTEDSPESPFQQHYRYRSIKWVGRILRRNMTNSEKILWQAIRKRRIDGLKFLRQHPIGVSVVDFYCHEKRLAIEIDGGYHLDSDIQERDAHRQELIELHGIQVFRCTAEEVENNLEAVLTKLRMLVV